MARMATPYVLKRLTQMDGSNNRDSCWLTGDGVKIRAQMQPLMEWVIAKTVFEGLAPSGRHVFCPQPDEAPHVVGKVASPIFTRARARPIVRIVRLSRPF